MTGFWQSAWYQGVCVRLLQNILHSFSAVRALLHSKCHTQPRTSNMHIPNCGYKVVNCFQLLYNKLVREIALVNDLNNVLIFFPGPDSPVMDSINFHDGRLVN
jgi:hypothetical protein